MKNLSFDEVRELASINPKAALRVHFSRSEDEPTQFYADQVIPDLLEEAKKMVEDGGYGVETVEEAMEKLEQVTYICSEEDYQEEQSTN
jgi:3-hydroxyacyl-CoA dehydrogenase